MRTRIIGPILFSTSLIASTTMAETKQPPLDIAEIRALLLEKASLTHLDNLSTEQLKSNIPRLLEGALMYSTDIDSSNK